MSNEKTWTTLAEMIMSVARKYRGTDNIAFATKVDGAYRGVGYDELFDDVEAVALGLKGLGLAKGDRIGITSENRLEWAVVDFACACSGIIDVPIFPILTADQLAYIFADAGVDAIVCSNAFQLRKAIGVRDRIPTLRHIIVMDPNALAEITAERRPDDGIITLDELKIRGRADKEWGAGTLTAMAAKVSPDDLLTLIYTSGTTGQPKGVMLTQRNLIANIIAALSVIDITESDVILSYLPLCHSFERMGGHYSCFAAGATIAFAQSIDTLVTNLAEVRPTIMTTVPRFLEKLKGRIESNAAKESAAKRKAFDWAIDVGRRWFRAVERKGSAGPILTAEHTLAAKLVYGTILERLGGRLRFFVSGGAPLSREVGEFYFGIGIPVIEGYGLTESSPVISANPMTGQKLGTVGKPIPGVDVRIAEDGEILARGPNIMRGYYNDPAATSEAIDAEGWLHTGDIGEIDAQGYLKITDRKKHLFVSSGGKNIAPAPIEDLLLGLPLIDQIMLIGDDRAYLTALIVPGVDAAIEAMRSSGIEGWNASDPAIRTRISGSDVIEAMIGAQIRDLQKDHAAFERVRRFRLLDQEFTVENGMLTPTLKVKRKEAMKSYHALIEEMYAGED